MSPAPTLFTITATAGERGQTLPAGATSVTAGSSLTVTIAGTMGSMVRDVLVDGVSVGPVSIYTFTNVQDDHTLSATFTQPDIINGICNALVTMLGAINGQGGGYFFDLTASGAKIERAPSLLDWATMPRPYLGVRWSGITDNTPGTSGIFRATGTFEIVFFVDIGSASAANLIDATNGTNVTPYTAEWLGARLAQDIMRAMAADVTLSQWLLTGIMWPGAVTVSQDPNIGAQAAGGVVTVNATWEWTT